MDSQSYVSYQPPAPPQAESDRRQRMRDRALLGRIGLALFIYLVFIDLVQYAAVYLARDFFPQALGTQWFRVVLTIVPSYLIGIPLIYGLLWGMPKKTPARSKLGASGWFTFLAAAYFGIMAGNYIGKHLMSAIESVRGTEIPNGVAQSVATSPTVVTLLLMVIAAPIAEELIFRKLVIDRLLPYSEKLAVLASALFFGLVHGNFYQFFYALLVGLIFGYVYVKTGNVLHTILMHMLLNFTGSVVADFIGNNIMASDASINHWNIVAELYSLSLLLLAVCGMALFIIKLTRLDLSSEGERQLSFKSQNLLLWSAGGTILLILLCAYYFADKIFI